MRREAIILLVLPPVFIALAIMADFLPSFRELAVPEISLVLGCFSALMCLVRGIAISKAERKTGFFCVGAGALYLCFLGWLFVAPLPRANKITGANAGGAHRLQ